MSTQSNKRAAFNSILKRIKADRERIAQIQRRAARPLSVSLRDGIGVIPYSNETLLFARAHDSTFEEPRYCAGLVGLLWVGAGGAVAERMNIAGVTALFPQLHYEMQHPLFSYCASVRSVFCTLVYRDVSAEQVACWLESAGL